MNCVYFKKEFHACSILMQGVINKSSGHVKGRGLAKSPYNYISLITVSFGKKDSLISKLEGKKSVLYSRLFYNKGRLAYQRIRHLLRWSKKREGVKMSKKTIPMVYGQPSRQTKNFFFQYLFPRVSFLGKTE